MRIGYLGYAGLCGGLCRVRGLGVSGQPGDSTRPCHLLPPPSSSP